MHITHTIWAMFSDGVEKVRAINRRYAKPRLAMSPAANVALLCLRIYLLLLVGLLGYKFLTIIM
jgi:hypothetical protein